MTDIRVKVEQEDMNMLEKAFYDMRSYTYTINYIIDSHKDEQGFVNSKAFEEFTTKAREALKKYEEVQAIITFKYIPSEMLKANNYQWEADFAKSELIVKEAF